LKIDHHPSSLLHKQLRLSSNENAKPHATVTQFECSDWVGARLLSEATRGKAKDVNTAEDVGRRKQGRAQNKCWAESEKVVQQILFVHGEVQHQPSKHITQQKRKEKKPEKNKKQAGRSATRSNTAGLG
jgi:hypothetical protein